MMVFITILAVILAVFIFSAIKLGKEEDELMKKLFEEKTKNNMTNTLK